MTKGKSFENLKNNNEFKILKVLKMNNFKENEKVKKIKLFEQVVNCSVYLPHWMVLALKQLAIHWFWVKPNINQTTKAILLWQFFSCSADFPDSKENNDQKNNPLDKQDQTETCNASLKEYIPPIQLLTDNLKNDFIKMAREAGDYLDEQEDYRKGEKLVRNIYVPLALSRVIRFTAVNAQCSMTYVITSALRDYLLWGTIPGGSEVFELLRKHRPSWESIMLEKNLEFKSLSSDSALDNKNQLIDSFLYSFSSKHSFLSKLKNTGENHD